jgi:outer membrane protein
MNVTRFMLATAAALVFAPADSARAQTLTLGEALDAALASHPALRAAELRVDAADARIGIARAQLLPSALSSATLTTFEEPMIVAPLHRLDPAHLPVFDRTLLQGQMGVQYTIFDGGARRALIRTAEAAGDITRERLASAEADLLTEVTAAYLAVLSAREVRAAAQRQVASLEGERTRADQRYDEGTVARVDILRAEAALQSARAEEVSAQSRVGLAERFLARVMGVDPGALSSRQFADVRWVSETPAASDAQRAAIAARGAPADATDPRIAAAQYAVDVARQRVAQERASRLPTVRGSAALLGFASGEWDPSTEWQAGVAVSWPVFTGGARGATIRQAEADLAVEEEVLRSTELVVATELDQADAAILEAGARTQALAAAVTQWEEVARIEALGLDQGAGVQHDFLRAEASLFQARAALSRARYDEVLGHVRRARAQGVLDRTWVTTALEAER